MPQNSKINTKKLISQELLSNKNLKKDFDLEKSLTIISPLFKVKKIFRELKKTKSKGFKAKDLFFSLIFSIFFDLTSIFSLSKNDHFLDSEAKKKNNNAKKDTYYRFLNNEKVNWRKLHSLYISRFYEIINENSFDLDIKKITPKCLIIDDSVLPKTGITIENIGRVHNHTTGGFTLGYKYLVLGLSDEKSFVPIDFTLQGEAGKNNRYGLNKKELRNRHTKKRAKNSAGKIRENEFKVDKLSNSLDMINRAVSNGIKAEYLLVDSWFFNDKMIKGIQDLDLKLIGQWRKGNQIVIVDNKEISITTLIEKFKRKSKESKYSRNFKSNYFELIVEFKGVKLKIFITRFKKNRNWNIVATTDLSLNFNKTMEYYSIRWSIEVYFKETKQLLNVGKNQSTCFDSQIAMITIANLQYIMLALNKRFNSYETIGQLFNKAKHSILESTIAERIIELMYEILDFIFQYLGLTTDKLEEYMEKIFQDDEKAAKIINLIEYAKMQQKQEAG